MKKAITDRSVKALKPNEKPYEINDPALRGFILRVQPSGAMTYYVSYRTPDGRRNRVKIGSYPALPVPRARKMAKKKLAEVGEGADPAKEKKEQRAAAQAMTLREFILDEWSPWYRQHRKAHDKQLLRLLGGFADLLDLPLRDLTQSHFERHRIQRSKKALTKKGKGKLPSPATLNRCNATMRPVLEMARRKGLISTNPLADVGKAKEDRNAAIRALTPEEETAILANFETQRRDLVIERHDGDSVEATPMPAPEFLGYFEPMFIVLLDSGIRRGEAMTLKWDDVDLPKGILHVRGAGAKSSQSRRVPLTPRAHDTLTRWRAYSNGPNVFPEATGESIRYWWLKTCDDAGITGVRLHDLRHSFGTRLAQVGAPITSIKLLMGHSSIVTTQRYLHATDEDARDAIALLAPAKKVEQ